jgi:hypothetical protein
VPAYARLNLPADDQAATAALRAALQRFVEPQK